MERSKAYFEGAKAGREAAKDGSLLHVIEPPETFSNEEKLDYTMGWLAGERAERDNLLIDEMEKHFGDVQ